MKILICCATQPELKVVKNQIKSLDLKVSLDIDYLCTWMGNHEAVFSLTRKILDSRYETLEVKRTTPPTPLLKRGEEVVVNIGVCGYRRKEKVIRKKLLDEDFLFVQTGLPRSLHSLAMTRLIQWSVIEHIDIGKENIVPIIFQFAEFGRIISSEVVVETLDKDSSSRTLSGSEWQVRNLEWQVKEWEASGWAVYLDMESYGIELVCQKFRIPRIYLKVPIDGTEEETKNFDREGALEKLRDNIDYHKLIKSLLDFAEKVRIGC